MDNQHFQYINKLPYFKEIYIGEKLTVTLAKDTGPGAPRWGDELQNLIAEMHDPDLLISVLFGIVKTSNVC